MPVQGMKSPNIALSAVAPQHAAMCHLDFRDGCSRGDLVGLVNDLARLEPCCCCVGALDPARIRRRRAEVVLCSAGPH